MKRAGAHKVLFGTDGPWLHPAVELAKVQALNIGALDRSLILGGNLLRLITPARGARGQMHGPRRRRSMLPVEFVLG